MKVRDSLSRGGKLIQKLGREAGNGVSKARDAVIRNETQIADAVQKATERIGKGTQLMGQAVVANARKASQALHNSAADASNTVRNKVESLGDGVTGNAQKAAASLAGGAAKGAVRIAGWAADGAVGVGKVVVAAGTLTERSAPAVAGGASGIARGSADAISGVLDAAVLSEREIRALRERLVTSGSKLQYDSARFETKVEVAKRDGNRKDLLDMLVVGGISLSDLANRHVEVPLKIQQAFRGQYPDLAAKQSFAEAIRAHDTSELVGFASGVKGKLFELELIDHLNSGILPTGFGATLATSATQPGWDIAIHDGHGQTLDLLQAKATESVSYVQEALKRYPDIDVVTTSEVHAELLARGLADRVQSSGISEAALEQKVDAAIAAGDASQVHNLLPSSLGLGMIALSVFVGGKGPLREQSSEFGQRGVKATATGLAGKAALAATHTWWIGLIVGVGSRWLIKHGNDKRDQYEALRRSLDSVESRGCSKLVGASPRQGSA